MVNLRNFGKTSILSLGVVAIASTAQAIPYNGNTVYKSVESNADYIYVSAAPNSQVQMITGGLQSASARMPNACGIIALSKPTNGWMGTIQAGGRTIDPATLQTKLNPSCSTATGELEEARTTDYKDASGRVYLVGFTAGQAATVKLPQTATRTATVNACGFARFTESSTAPWQSSSAFTIEGTEYTFGTLPVAPGGGPQCRRIGNSNEGYIPTDWTEPRR